ncbi:MAG: hypothetical protein IJG52_05850 [Lachnospiraceae bacterium]|nr:hypothetical protein [Lachnospiraceae bacterium]
MAEFINMNTLSTIEYIPGDALTAFQMIENEAEKALCLSEYCLMRESFEEAEKYLQQALQTHRSGVRAYALRLSISMGTTLGKTANCQKREKELSSMAEEGEDSLLVWIEKTAIYDTLFAPGTYYEQIRHLHKLDMSMLSDGVRLRCLFIYCSWLFNSGRLKEIIAVRRSLHFMMDGRSFPLPFGCILIQSAIAFDSLRMKGKAVQDIKTACDFLQPDGFTYPFVLSAMFLSEDMVDHIARRWPECAARIRAAYKEYIPNRIRRHNQITGNSLSFELTRREREVAALCAAGLSNKMIADDLHISANTVRAILHSVFYKLGIEKRTDLKNYVFYFEM